ncbi:UDP-glucose 4-epimerase GalE [Defluviicoccus vanus]|uniref:UDP-glucose 4-epimerase n=1 Tax=Defluviicoccus vanus TaxID=111831 RepID=A0A7H1N346_9PROT|nr:UDP-glucose 4-epimerase GalE [Defluviicoccus vanus]QNT70132.1 UDP-glucose 4-epimerase GalE [Defluviicoccus vanus]
MTSGRRAVVTGGAGYIGSHVVLALVEAGWDVVVVDDLSTGRREAVPPMVTFVHGDVGDCSTIEAAMARHRPHAVLHFAGSIVVTESVADPLKYYRNNTAASRTVIEAANAFAVKVFIFSSTAAVYGAPDGIAVAEDAPTEPINPYGRSKLFTEMILRDVAAVTPMRYVALRYFNVAGADPKGRAGQTSPGSTHLIKVACEAALGVRADLEIYGDDYPTPDGTCVRDFIHVSDLADAHVLAIEYLLGGGENAVLNCGYGHGWSVKTVVEIIRCVAGVPFEVRIKGRRPGDPPSLVADPSKIRSRLGWRPKHDDLRFIVESALAWERTQLISRGG